MRFIRSFLLLKKARFHGFTLSELLIAVAIWGIVATFAVSKVLVAINTQVSNTRLKNIVASLSQYYLEADQKGFNFSGWEQDTYFRSKFDYLKQCYWIKDHTNCSADAALRASYPVQYWGYMLKDGSSFSSGWDTYHWVTEQERGWVYMAKFYFTTFDINGANALPNVIGQDIFNVVYNPNGYTYLIHGTSVICRPHSLCPRDNASSVQYNKVFSGS
jgi:prepilin-type N-terminal cleavage/methylation domain-containing protein